MANESEKNEISKRPAVSSSRLVRRNLESVISETGEIITYRGQQIRAVETDGVFRIRRADGEPGVGEEIIYRETKKLIREARSDGPLWVFCA